MTAWRRAEDPGSTQPLLTAVVFSGPAVPIAAPCLVVGADVKQRAAAFLHPLPILVESARPFAAILIKGSFAEPCVVDLCRTGQGSHSLPALAARTRKGKRSASCCPHLGTGCPDLGRDDQVQPRKKAKTYHPDAHHLHHVMSRLTQQSVPWSFSGASACSMRYTRTH